MTDSALDFLDKKPAEKTIAEIPAGTPATATAEAPGGIPATPPVVTDGASSAALEAGVKTGDEITPTPGATQSYVPIQGLLTERDKRQAAEAENAAMRERIAALEAGERERAAKQTKTQIDPVLDPDGYRESIASENEAQMRQIRFDTSKALHSKFNEGGAAAVNEAEAAFQAAAEKSPLMYAELNRAEDPYEYVLNWHKREKALAEIGTDTKTYRQKVIDEYLAAEAAKLATADAAATGQPAATPATVVATPVTPAATAVAPRLPGSLAALPGSNAGQKAPVKSGFDAAIAD